MNSGASQEKRRPSAVTREQREREFPFSERDYRYLSSLVYERSGIVLGESKMNMIYSRLARRLRELRLSCFGDYCDMLRSECGDQEIGFLINAVTTNLTRFLREKHHFDHLRDEVRGVKQARQSIRKIRIWSAGCSSGEEPYSIAMTLILAIPDLAKWDVRILATDLDTKVVASGMAGLYQDQAIAELPIAYRTKFFTRAATDNEKVWQIAEPLRRLVTFKHLNLLNPWPMTGPFDAIFCRNVMIYFDGPTKTRLVERFAELLKPGGYLYVGHAESLLDHNHRFQLTARTAYRKIA